MPCRREVLNRCVQHFMFYKATDTIDYPRPLRIQICVHRNIKRLYFLLRFRHFFNVPVLALLLPSIIISMTSKKSPNVYKSCPKTISQEKLKILTPLQKLPKNVGDLGKLIVAKGFEKLLKVQ